MEEIFAGEVSRFQAFAMVIATSNCLFGQLTVTDKALTPSLWTTPMHYPKMEYP